MLDSQSRGLVSKPLAGSKIDFAFHSSEVDEMSARYTEDLVVKSKLSSCSSSVALRHLKSIHEKGP